WLAAFIFFNLRDEDDSLSEWRVLGLGVLPAWIGAFATSASLWATRWDAPEHYSEVLTSSYQSWLWPLGVVFVSCFVLGWQSATGRHRTRATVGFLAAIGATAVIYLCLTAVYWLYGQWWHYHKDEADRVWQAYAFGPSLVLISLALGVVTLIGLL